MLNIIFLKNEKLYIIIKKIISNLDELYKQKEAIL